MGVFDYLESDDIVTVLSISRDLYASIRPSIYSTISWQWDIVPRACIPRLLRAILQFPELAPIIQHVSILSSLEHFWKEGWKDDDQDGQDEILWSQDLESFSDS